LGSSVRLVNSQPLDSSDAAEGGYLEISDIPSASGRSVAAQETPSWNYDEDTPSNSGTRNGRPEDAVPFDGGLGKNDGNLTDPRSTGDLQLELAEQDPSRLLNASEGGMIELAVARPQDIQPVSTQTPPQENGELFANAKEVKLDQGIGLFHAFELATAPARQGDPAGKISEKTGEADATPEANLSPSPADPSVEKQSATENHESGKQVTYQSAALTSVFFAAMLVPMAGSRRAKRSS
jgi:hypothetical protein